MSEQPGFTADTSGQPQEPPVGNEQTGENPAWQELYQVLPDSLRPVVAPVLEKWESGTQRQFQQNAETMKAYEPYQPLIDAGIPVDRIEQALAVAQLIDTDPRGFLQQMQQFFPEEEAPQGEQQQQQQTFEEQPFSIETDPNFRKVQEQQDLLAQVLYQQLEADKAKQEDEALDQELNRLTQTYGEFDEDYVFGLALNGVELEDAVKRYFQKIEQIRTAPRPDAGLPQIIPPGGGMPSERIDPANMTDAQRRAYVVAALAQAHNQGAT
jgi:hypothetical protein